VGGSSKPGEMVAVFGMFVARGAGDDAEQLLCFSDPPAADQGGCGSPRGEGEVGGIAGSPGELEHALGRDEGILAPLVENDCLRGDHILLEEPVTALPQERKD